MSDVIIDLHFKEVSFTQCIIFPFVHVTFFRRDGKKKCKFILWVLSGSLRTTDNGTIWELGEEMFQLWKESYRFQRVKDMVILAEMSCPCTSCRWLFFSRLPESVGHLASLVCMQNDSLGWWHAKKSSLGIACYFLTLYHERNHATNTEVLW